VVVEDSTTVVDAVASVVSSPNHGTVLVTSEILYAHVFAYSQAVAAVLVVLLVVASPDPSKSSTINWTK
jgi:hypothetical protein